MKHTFALLVIAFMGAIPATMATHYFIVTFLQLVMQAARSNSMEGMLAAIR